MIRKNEICLYLDSDIYVMLALRRRFRQVVVANEILDRADVVVQFLGSSP